MTAGDGDGRQPSSIRRAVAALARGRRVIPRSAGGAVRAERAGDRRAGDGQATTALSPHRGGPGRCPRAHRAGAGGAGGGAGARHLPRRSAQPPLPRQRAPLVGREEDVRADRRPLARRRGSVADADRSRWRRQDQPGACRCATPPSDAFAGDVAFVPLATITDAALVASEVAAALGLRPPASSHRTRSCGRHSAPAACCWCWTTSNICPRRRSGWPTCWRHARV